MNKRSMGASFVYRGSALVLIVCAGCDLLPLGGGGAEAIPVSVGVFVEPRALTSDASQGAGDAVRLVELESTFARELARALETSGAVVRARPVAAGSLEEARAKGAVHDVLAVVELEAAQRADAVGRPLPLAAAEVVLWLFGGVPSWFLPSVEWELPLRASCSLLDLGADTAAEGAATAAVEGARLSLFERSDPLERPVDYLLTVIMPPMFVVPGDPERASRSLTRELCGGAAAELAVAAASQIRELASSAAVQLAFDVRRSSAESVSLRLLLESKDAVPLAALDLHRFAPGAPRYRWVASAEQLAVWNGVLQSEEAPGRAVLVLPEPVPLGPGENAIKVRVLRSDGVKVSRTVVVEGPPSEEASE